MSITIIVCMFVVYLIIKDVCKSLDIAGLLRQHLHDRYDKRR